MPFKDPKKKKDFHKKYGKSRYQWRKAHNLCTSCGEKPCATAEIIDYAGTGKKRTVKRTKCTDCLEKTAAREREIYALAKGRRLSPKIAPKK